MKEKKETSIFYYLGVTVRWILIVFLLMIALGALVSGDNLSGIIILIVAILTMPIKVIDTSWNKLKIPRIGRIGLLLLLFSIGMTFASSEDTNTELATNDNVAIEETEKAETNENSIVSDTKTSENPSEVLNEVNTEDKEVLEDEVTEELDTEKEINEPEPEEEIEVVEIEEEVASEDEEESSDTTEPEEVLSENEEETDETEYEAPKSSYVANINSMKFHETYCSSVKSMKSSNRKDITATREEIINMGYDPCKRCNP